jgi:hypothetical protein
MINDWKETLAEGLTNYTGRHCQLIDLESINDDFKEYPLFALIKKNGSMIYGGRAIGVKYRRTEYALFYKKEQYGLPKEGRYQHGYPSYNFYHTWDYESIIKIEGRLTKEAYRKIWEAIISYNGEELK